MLILGLKGLKAAPCTDRFLNIQCTFSSIRVYWHICLSKRNQKLYDSAFGSVADGSTIHLSLKRLKKTCRRYKQSYYLKSF